MVVKRIARIWHGVRHDDYAVSEIEIFGDWHLSNFAKDLKRNGGFILPDRTAFIPFHRINYIEWGEQQICE
jgi:hypothetical protein